MADVDVLIIGAGPAGLAAATSARRAGATVRVLEASDDSGGQFWRHLPASQARRRRAAIAPPMAALSAAPVGRRR